MGETLRIQRSRRMHVAVGNDGDGNVLGPRGVLYFFFLTLHRTPWASTGGRASGPWLPRSAVPRSVTISTLARLHPNRTEICLTTLYLCLRSLSTGVTARVMCAADGFSNSLSKWHAATRWQRIVLSKENVQDGVMGFFRCSWLASISPYTSCSILFD
jgi:hypothetical protein